MHGREKTHLNPKLYSDIISASPPLQSDPYENSTPTWPWGFWHSDNVGIAERIYPASPENTKGWTQSRLGEDFRAQ